MKTKSYTDIVQAKQLADILPIESADSVIVSFGNRDGVKTVVMPSETLNAIRTPFSDIRGSIPCWSLAALMNLLPETIVPDNGSHQVYQMSAYNYDSQHCIDYVGEIESDSYIGFAEESFIDACVKMIIHLKEKLGYDFK